MRSDRTGNPRAHRPAAGISGSILALPLVALASLLFLAAPAPAAAAVVTDRPLLFSFDGSGTEIGHFDTPKSIAVDSAGNLYVVNGASLESNRVLCEFDPEGESLNFSALGKPCIAGTSKGPFKQLSDVAIDTSEVNPGRIYVSEDFGAVHAFAPDGTYLWTLDSGFSACGVAVDPAGHLWVVDCEPLDSPEALEFDTTGTGAPSNTPIASFPLNHGEGRRAAFPAVDNSGNDFYLALGYVPGKEPNLGAQKYVGGVYTPPPLREGASSEITIDQSIPAGHIFTANILNPPKLTPTHTFSEFASSDTELGEYGFQVLGHPLGIAYNPTLDRVYVSDGDSATVKAFGPATTGTAPDVSSQATDSVGLHSATAHATINPLGLPNSYHFEWKPCNATECKGESSWGVAESQSLPYSSIEPTDSSSHPVSLVIDEYKGKRLASNTWFEVRLVGTNTENRLSTYSTPDVFKTLVPPAPVVESCDLSAITTESVHLACTIDPQEEETTWRVLRLLKSGATKAECETAPESSFTQVATDLIPDEESSTVEEDVDLTGLPPAGTVCVRVLATNKGGTDSMDLVFRTDAVAPSEAETAFTAPRTDTTARINGLINPEGETDVKFHFELSIDGVNWTALPELESSVDARKKIVVGDDLSGLEPNTTYHYRLAAASNSAGPAPDLPGEGRTFTTRNSAEVHPPSPCPNEEVRQAQHSDSYFGSCRGIELVNSPDKGNQHVHAEIGLGTSPLRADGEVAIWNVFAGAPDGNSGAGATFLAKRSEPSESAPNGWDSHSLIPPGEEQVDEAETGGYFPLAATPDFSAFVFIAGKSALSPGRTLVRLDADQNQTLLKEYNENLLVGGADLTDDGAHVLFVDKDPPHQLEDIGIEPHETVSLMPDGLPDECGLDTASFVGAGAGVAAAKHWRPGYHMIATTDGSRVYFQAKPNADERNPSQSCETSLYGIYVRNREAGETTLIDPGTGEVSPQFIRATPDGREAYFLTASELDPIDTNSHGDVYRWSEEAGESSCLTCAIPDADVTFKGAGAGGAGGVLVSDDFSHIYFESTSQLIPEQGKTGDGNVYVLSDGEIRFVADPDNGANGSLGRGTSELSTDGNVLLLKTRGLPSLTSDEIAANQTQLYRYDDRDASIECVSCRRGGLTARAIAPDITTRDFQMSADGDTIAFPTPEALVPLDVNRGIDVYAWRDGVISLLTDGVSSFPESFLATPRVYAVSADGSDILFSLVDPGLTGFEHDGFANLYDARIEGGFFAPNPPAHCVEDSCQGPLLAAPPIESTATLEPSRGNPPTHRPPCRKGRVRRHGRCLKPRRHRHRHGRKRVRANPRGMK